MALESPGRLLRGAPVPDVGIYPDCWAWGLILAADAYRGADALPWAVPKEGSDVNCTAWSLVCCKALTEECVKCLRK